MLNLRGHHLFCTALFEGRGYSSAFCENMARVTRDLSGGAALTVGCAADDICAHCPNRTPAGGCATGGDDVARKDRLVLDALELPPGRAVDGGTVRAALRERLTPRLFEEVCGDCSWLREGLCSYGGLRRLEAGFGGGNE